MQDKNSLIQPVNDDILRYFSISEKDTLIHVKTTVNRKDFSRIGMTREECSNSYRSSKLFLKTDVSEIETRGGNITKLSLKTIIKVDSRNFSWNTSEYRILFIAIFTQKVKQCSKTSEEKTPESKHNDSKFYSVICMNGINPISEPKVGI